MPGSAHPVKPPSDDASDPADGRPPPASACATESDGPWPVPEARTAMPDRLDIVDEWGHHSFPASDPPANW